MMSADRRGIRDKRGWRRDAEVGPPDGAPWYVDHMMFLGYNISIAGPLRGLFDGAGPDPGLLQMHLTTAASAILTGFAFGCFYSLWGFPLSSWLIDRRNAAK